MEDTVKILRGLKPYYEKHHSVRYTNDGLRTAVELAHRYIHDRKLPDKAIDVIDEAGAAQALLPESRRRKQIGVKEVEAIVWGIVGKLRRDGQEPTYVVRNELPLLTRYLRQETERVLAERSGGST